MKPESVSTDAKPAVVVANDMQKNGNETPEHGEPKTEPETGAVKS